jgi:hypothetical protein
MWFFYNASSKDSSDTDTDTDTDAIDIDIIPDTLTNAHIDLDAVVGSGAFKTAYNLKGQPDLLVVLLKSGYNDIYIDSISVSVSVRIRWVFGTHTTQFQVF